MIQTLTKNWWLLVVCGILYAVMAVINFSNAANGVHHTRDIVFLARVALLAGACTIVAGVWGARNAGSWFLALGGIALVALGPLLSGIAGPAIKLRTIVLLMILMAVSLGIAELAAARTMRGLHQLRDGWVLALAGIVSVAFALPFVALGRWIRLQPGSNPEFLWFGLYFAFSAICLLGMALRLHSLRGGMPGALP